MRIYINNIFKKRNNNNINEYTEKNKEELINKVMNQEEKKEINYVRKGAKSNNIIKLNIKKESQNKIKKNGNSKEKKKSKNRDFKLNKYNLPKSYYALLTFMFFLAGLSIHLLRKTNENLMVEDYAVFNSQIDDFNINNLDEVNNGDDSSIQNEITSNVDTRNDFQDETSSVSTNVITQVQEKVNNIVEKKEEPLVFVKPIDGEISKIFSDDKVIYSKTLEMWKTHDGIDVKANEGEIVYSIERGTVEKIYNDAFYGVTIVINHGQGYKSSYSNLTEDTFVEVGDKVKKSQKIGKIGTTSIGEIKDEPHLHFMLYENDIVSDPSSIFK